MSATTVKVVSSPTRSPERRRLADAIAAHDAAVKLAERVNDALTKLDDRLFEDMQPAARLAREALDDAIAAAPELLVASALGEPVEADAGPTVAEAEEAVRQADARVAEVRQQRSLLRDEAAARRTAVEAARCELENTVKAAVLADPARAAVLAEYRATADRALRCAKVLRTIGTPVQGATGHGLMFRITDAPVAIDKIAFVRDAEWVTAVEMLRSDPDAPLPDLPPPDPDIGVDGGQVAA